MDADLTRLWPMVLATLVAVSGCRSLSRESPVPAAVASGRQLSQQGQIACERGEYRQARQHFEQAIRLCPNDIEARRRLADLLAQQGDFAAAALQLEDARKMAATDAGLAVQLGEVCFAAGQSQRAWELANEALDRQPGLARAWVLRGRVQHQSGQLQAALADYLRGLDYQRDDRQAMHLAAQLYLDLKRPDRAWTMAAGLRGMYEAGKEPAELLALEARILNDLGRTVEAAQRLAQVERAAKPR
jgi:tetratricopeptide (TPR) repeat protein